MAKEGDVQAQYEVCLCYLNGVGVEKNRTTAEIWMKKGRKRLLHTNRATTATNISGERE